MALQLPGYGGDGPENDMRRVRNPSPKGRKWCFSLHTTARRRQPSCRKFSGWKIPNPVSPAIITSQHWCSGYHCLTNQRERILPSSTGLSA